MMASNMSQAFEHVSLATQHFYAGDATAFKALWSHGRDVTIFGVSASPELRAGC